MSQPAMRGVPPAIERLSVPPGEADLRDLAQLLVDAVESGAAVSFLAPLSLERARDWWRRTLEASRSEAIVLVARADERIVGTVQIHAAWAPNQPHRAEVAKLLVDPARRGAGLGERLMRAIEAAAAGAGFRLLTLDAKRGTAAERLYRRLGWTYAGAIPGFALDPDGVTPHDAVIFYKQLGDSATEAMEADVTSGRDEVARLCGQLDRVFAGEAWHGRPVLEVLASVTAEQAAARPIDDAHSIAEIVNHIAAWLSIVRLRVGGTPIGEITAEIDWPPSTDASRQGWDAAREHLRQSYFALATLLERLTDADLDRELQGKLRNYTVYEDLHGVIQHSVYHLGQVVLLANATGRPTR